MYSMYLLILVLKKLDFFNCEAIVMLKKRNSLTWAVSSYPL